MSPEFHFAEVPEDLCPIHHFPRQVGVCRFCIEDAEIAKLPGGLLIRPLQKEETNG